MAIYGIGAYYKADDENKKTEFIKRNVACIGFGQDTAPGLHRIMDSIEIGDIVYIKSFDPRRESDGLKILAVGIVEPDFDNGNSADNGRGAGLGECIPVHWIDLQDDPIKLGTLWDDEKNNVRNNTLYKEYNPNVQEHVVAVLKEAIGSGRPLEE